MIRVYLVHGTRPLSFLNPRDAAPRWYRPVADRLRRSLGDDVDVRKFRWAGSNSVRARTLASDELGAAISRDSTASPADGVYLLCHSHGGTVALDCLHKHGARFAADGISLKGVIALATAFIIRVPREDEDRAPHLTLLAAFFAPVLFALYLTPGPFHWDPLDPNWQVSLVFATLIAVFFSIGLAGILEWTARKRKTAAPGNELQTRSLPPIHLLRMTGDEASGFLIFASFWSWLSNRVFGQVQLYRVIEKDVDKRLKPPALRIGMLALLGGIAAAFIIHHSYPSIPADSLFFPSVVSVLIVASMAAWIAIIVHCAYLCSCGIFSPGDWITLRVYVEQAPLRVPTIFEILDSGRRSNGFRHGLHSSETVQDRICQIIATWHRSDD